MQKRIFIVHSWLGSPEDGWYPWLKTELEKKGFIVETPSMPDTAHPKINLWVKMLATLVKTPDEHTYFVAHSIGCQTVLRYLQKLNKEVKIGGAVFVAPWTNLSEASYETEDDRKTIKPWLKNDLKWDKILEHCSRFTAVFSDNDLYVPLANATLFEEKLKAKIVLEYGKHHFMGSEGIHELPIVLQELENLLS